MRNFQIRALLAALFVGALTGCENVAAPVGAAAGDGGRAAFDLAADTTVQLVELNWDTATYVLENVIGNKGGALNIGPHQLVVNKDAVSSPTRFVMTIRVGKYLLMDLTAFRVSDGAQITTLANEVNLDLSYQDLSWMGDPDRLSVVYLTDGTPQGRKEKIASAVDKTNRKVKAKLKHFSTYSMGIN